MVPLGVGEFVGALTEGYIIDKLGNRTASIINIVLIAATTALVCWNILHLTFGIQSFIMCGFWGMLDAAINV